MPPLQLRMSVWLFSCLLSGRPCTVEWWAGYTVVLAFPSCTLSSCALGVLVSPLVTPLGTMFQLTLNWFWRRDVLGCLNPSFHFFLILTSCPARALLSLGEKILRACASRHGIRFVQCIRVAYFQLNFRTATALASLLLLMPFHTRCHITSRFRFISWCTQVCFPSSLMY